MNWKYLCDTSDIASNSLKLVDVDGIRIVVANYGEGFRAMPPICPHMEEPLEESGVIASCVLTCTKHLWAWDLRNLDLIGETEKPLKTYDLKQEGNRLYALIEQELEYDFDEEAEDDDDFFAKA
ncbi:Rieske 2Fe-2S domain-containing protein [Methylobacterium nodulans]|uniref:Rieske (2Fe-2S) domain protein n=1 Tax=Methylobacterium nodulans (strain LMG 21967 / CNCM I-2342 / ORS 2060) TaxID=460265 RepID=B8IFD2_METNO|nr:Rieske 2Fe-2S domain-containing protein [Methylobacterium nodulans]ACL57667.1 Rieske (2Fe-2S) domain protein [Methylobacterium nodulans ORS 2060]